MCRGHGQMLNDGRGGIAIIDPAESSYEACAAKDALIAEMLVPTTSSIMRNMVTTALRTGEHVRRLDVRSVAHCQIVDVRLDGGAVEGRVHEVAPAQEGTQVSRSWHMPLYNCVRFDLTSAGNESKDASTR